MKCNICIYDNNCKLKKIALELTGCEGYSKLKPPKEGQLQCYSCKGWFDESRIFKNKYETRILKHKYKNRYLCFDCY